MTTQMNDVSREPTFGSAAAGEALAPRRRPAWWQIAVFGLVMALLGLVAFQMRRNGPLAAGQVGEGELAPTFDLQTFDGDTLRLSDLRGQVVVINFWASWCKPCEEEADELENAWRHYKDQGVVFLGVDYTDTEPEARAYLARFDITYPNGPDLGTAISHSYRIRGVPETFVVDQEGILRALFVGPTTRARLQAEIEPLLND
jgi:cytochrome c biogenesis protein CcmG/thiol:disulfide interchange protein DsbE